MGARLAALALCWPRGGPRTEPPTWYCKWYRCCVLLQEDFKPVVAASSGFRYRPERPDAPSLVAQKWAWTSSEPGGLGGCTPHVHGCPCVQEPFVGAALQAFGGSIQRQQ